MSGAEMVIRLVDGSEAEQAAFDRSPTDQVEAGSPTVGGVSSPNAARSETVEAIAAGFATIDAAKATKADFTHDSTASVASVHEQLAALSSGNDSEKPQQGETRNAEGASSQPSTDDYRGFRAALTDLAQRLTPKLFADPIARLIEYLSVTAPPVQTTENRQTQVGPPPVQTAENRLPPAIPAVGHVEPKTPPAKPAKPEKHEKKPSIGDRIRKVQHKIANIPFAGVRINRMLDRGMSAAKRITRKVQGAGAYVKPFTKVASSIGKKIAGTKVGKAVVGAGRSAVGAIARTVGATAASGAASGGTAAATATGGGAAAAGGALLSNPVGLAVGAVVASFAVLALSAKALNDTFASEADRLEKYSANIAIARGNKQITTELNMLDRAKKIDGPLGSLENSKAALNSQMEKLWTEILTVLIPLAPTLEKGIDFLSLIVANTRENVATVSEVIAVIQGYIASLTPGQQDDIDAQRALMNAMNSIVLAQKDQADLWKKMQNGGAPQGNGNDPMLMSLLNARTR